MTFLDTNIILRFLTWDDPIKAERCEKLFKRVAAGKTTLFTSTMVIAEVLWTLEKAYKIPKTQVARLVGKMLNTPNIHLDEKDTLLAALSLHELRNMDFIDAYNAMVMQSKDIHAIYSYDKDFDLMPPIQRLEP